LSQEGLKHSVQFIINYCYSIKMGDKSLLLYQHQMNLI
jgi:hypothetical protein